MHDPVLSVLISTYNHGEFVTEAIEGVLIQETTFPFEIVISDDCSTDGTWEIIESFQRKYPKEIRAFFAESNQGGHANFDKLYAEARGSYIATLEGDDYWTSPYKLQKTVDFLVENEDFSICFHNLEIRREGRKSKSRRTTNPKEPLVSGLSRITKFNYIWTASCVFRNGLIDKVPAWVHDLPLGDWPLVVLLAEKGDIRFLDEVMGVYRIHKGGVWSGQSNIRRLVKTIRVAEVCKRHLRHRGFDDCIYKTSRTVARLAWEKGKKRKSLRYLFKAIGVICRNPLYGMELFNQKRKQRQKNSNEN